MARRVSYTQKTLDKLRKEGWLPAIVERRVFGNVVRDLWGIIDILAVKPGIILAVQSTSLNAATKHRKILRECSDLELIKSTGIRVELWLWRKNEKTNRWECIIEGY